MLHDMGAMGGTIRNLKQMRGCGREDTAAATF